MRKEKTSIAIPVTVQSRVMGDAAKWYVLAICENPEGVLCTLQFDAERGRLYCGNVNSTSVVDIRALMEAIGPYPKLTVARMRR